MIFVSIALLFVAAISLGIGISASAVPPLVVSIVATCIAAVLLWASFIQYRKEAAEGGAEVAGLGGNIPRRPGYPEVYRANVEGFGPVVIAPQGGSGTNGHPSVPDGWDDLDPTDAAALVESFNLDELHALRRHEVEHEHRGDVLSAIDGRIDNLVDLRRRLSAG